MEFLDWDLYLTRVSGLGSIFNHGVPGLGSIFNHGELLFPLNNFGQITVLGFYNFT
jgi:hypothetical protein